MGEKDELIEIVGAENVTDDTEVLDDYSADRSFAVPKRPRFVVKPANTDEVQRIVKWSNQTLTPLVPVSSGPPHFHGDTVPGAEGAVIVDLSGMKRVLGIDLRNRIVEIEPGVTYSQLLPVLAEKGLTLSQPLLPRGNKSIIASLLEREPTLIPRYHNSMSEPLRCLKLIWGNGETFNAGEAVGIGQFSSVPLSPWGPAQQDWCRFVSAAQGSMGIVTQASLRCKILPQLHKLFLVPAKHLDDLLGFAYRVLRFRYGDEFLFLNHLNLASILGEEAGQIAALTEALPPWTLILGIAGRNRLPEERVGFQEKDMIDIAREFGLQMLPEIPVAADGEKLKEMLLRPREPFWKLRYKGGCQDIFFITTLNRTPEFVNTLYSVSEQMDYPTSDIGVYIQPMLQGTCCHCEFNIPYDSASPAEVSKVRELLPKASGELVKRGAFFSRPYGIWADMVYNRDAQTGSVLKRVKGIFDPNNVMNPGKLCFQV